MKKKNFAKIQSHSKLEEVLCPPVETHVLDKEEPLSLSKKGE